MSESRWLQNNSHRYTKPRPESAAKTCHDIELYLSARIRSELLPSACQPVTTFNLDMGIHETSTVRVAVCVFYLFPE